MGIKTIPVYKAYLEKSWSSSWDSPYNVELRKLLGHKSSKTTEIYNHVSTKSIQGFKGR
jgi:integrase